MAGVILMALTTGARCDDWDTWPPRSYLVRSLAGSVESTLASQDPATGRFGTQPWICTDQNVLLPLAAAWAIEDPENPWYHDQRLLEAIGKGGEALVDDQDAKGMWIFRKKDNSTWGQIHMPWTYSRWIRAYMLVRDALPPAVREKWERGLKLGYSNIRTYFANSVHNIPTHHAMGLYIAGEAFGMQDWKDAVRPFMAKVVDHQDPAGYWSEHSGPVVGYNAVYVEALGVYYSFSQDPVALEALRRSALFHSSILWPDGSSVSCIDERQVYHGGVDRGNVGFSWTPEGRGFLLTQLARYANGGTRLVDADWAASMLLYGGSGEGTPPPAGADRGQTIVGDNGALIKRDKPWQWALSAYACEVSESRWIQDRQNLVDIFHDELGLVAGGGNTKMQPYWSTFTVGDTSKLQHKPGDENPNFRSAGGLRWTPDSASVDPLEEPSRLSLKYGPVECSVTVALLGDGSLAVTYRAPSDVGVEAHLPLMNRGGRLKFAGGDIVPLDAAPVNLSRKQAGAQVEFRGLLIDLPEGASLMWPARQHNPYTKDGSSPLSSAKLVVVMPFAGGVTEQTVRLSRVAPQPFDGLAFEARDIPSASETGTRTKRLDDVGSQFLGAEAPGESITFTLPAVPAGAYELLGEFVLAQSYGVVQVSVDGQTVGAPFDGYSPALESDGQRVSFGKVTLTEGEHKLKLEVIGKNEKSERHFISVKRWLLKPVN
ncbi:MAG: hypothetical protein KBI47_20210 [Armatimonadetes bacterium]|nr:hypothetical protein [Armatimonadota bacterium]